MEAQGEAMDLPPPPPWWQPSAPTAVEAPPPAPARAKRRGIFFGAGLALLSLAGGLAGGAIVESRNSTTTTAANAATIERASLDFNGQSLDVAAALAKVQASVVSIETSVRVRQGLFVQQGSGAGTGVVLDGNGDILTNAHVVADATSVQVTVPGESTPRDATVVASNTEQDIAVVHVDNASGLTPATFGDSDAVQVGDQVIAVGNALALEGGFTVTEGIVSALNRTIQTDASSSLAHLIQTDAAISSGNSGGALVNAQGEVIGINTAVASSSGSVQASNIGFAISINTAKAEAEALLAQRS